MGLVNEINEKREDLTHDIYVCKILLLILNYQGGADPQYIDKDLYINRLYDNIKQNLELYIESPTNKVLYNLLDNDFFTIQNILRELKEDLYKHFKLVQIMTIDNMKESEIIAFYGKLKDKLNNFKDLDEACTYIYYHSGVELSSFITKLCEYIKSLNNSRSEKLGYFEYFLTKQNIISIYYKEWIDIFEHLRSAMKYLKTFSPVYQELNQMYQELLILSFIVVCGGKASEV